MVEEAGLDFETYSEVDLKKCGAYVYAAHPSTDILCVRYQLDDGEVLGWEPGDPLPHDLFAAERFRSYGPFERLIWAVAERLYGWPPVPEIPRWRDTMASVAYRALPLGLEGAAPALSLGEVKNPRGKQLIKLLSVPQKPSKKSGHSKPWRNYDVDLLAEMGDYCAQDVVVERAVIDCIGPLPEREQRVWELDQRMNDRGIKLDVEAVRAADSLIDRVLSAGDAKLYKLTGEKVERASQGARVVEWVNERCPGVMKNYQADHIDVLLKMDLPKEVIDVLEIRKRCGKASVHKIKAMSRCLMADGRARGQLQYHGADTGRWAGRLIQPHNFPLPEFPDADPYLVLDDIKTGDIEYLEMMYGEPLAALANALKPILMADEGAGKELTSGDFSAIEARGVMWAAGQQDALGMFASGADIYCALGSEIFNRPVTKADLLERQCGKVGILGSGFQMGAKRAHEQGLEKGADPEVWTLELAEKTIQTYRSKYSRVPDMWRAVNDAAIAAVQNTGKTYSFGPVEYKCTGQWLTCRLPNGKRLWYRDPKVKMVQMPWHTEDDPAYGAQLCYMAYRDGRWKLVWTYGGKLVENFVQAIARELMVEGMFRAEAENLPLIFTVHDELDAEPFKRKGDPDYNWKLLKQVLEVVPPWAKGYPIAAECWAGPRWKK